METVGIICEYNPLHLGHKKQMDQIRALLGPDTGIVCLMSGDFVQRGTPAIVSKLRRAEAAVRCGADLVLELPVTVSLSSAEGFAAGGVKILSPFCTRLCFGAETADEPLLMQITQALLREPFKDRLRSQLEKGLSFPAARQAALESMGLDATVLERPNNILAVEYCKAIVSQGSPMAPMVISRGGDYHDTQADSQDPSATALRSLMLDRKSWLSYVPEAARDPLAEAPLHTLSSGERAILARLRCMTEAEFEALPYGSEGLWRKLMHAVRSEATLEDILTATKSKRYTRSRLDRMVMCAFLGITEETMQAPVPYVRALAFNDRGRELLKKARQAGHFPNIGQPQDHPYQVFEDRCSDLYGLFRRDIPEAPGANTRQRVCCLDNA